jgi:UDP-N-acetylmuramoylalanine--D-glutamate ligase
MKIEPGAKVLIVGAARSGIAAVDLAVSRGLQVSIYDDYGLSKDVELDLLSKGVRVLSAVPEHPDLDFVVLSPAIKPDHIVVKNAHLQQISVLSEVDFAAIFFAGKIIGITGSNGKTTSTMLAEHVFKRSGLVSCACGNIGYPFSRLVLDFPDCEWAVIELSSYQLEMTSKMRMSAGILLNLSVDHLERHGSMQAYLNAKMRIVNLIDSDGTLVYNLDDHVIAKAVSTLNCSLLSFSTIKKADISLSGKKINFPSAVCTDLLDSRQPQIIGEHNLQNIMAVSLACWSCGVPINKISEAILDFEPVEHRIEEVAQFENLNWVNDSKATNVDSTIQALKCFPEKNVILLAGGKTKTEEFSQIDEYVSKHLCQLIVYGEDAWIFSKWFTGKIPVTQVSTLSDAVDFAYKVSIPGNTILLSPMCASFDQFKDFEERGHVYKKLVNALKMNLENR